MNLLAIEPRQPTNRRNLEMVAKLSVADKTLASALVKRNAFQLVRNPCAFARPNAVQSRLRLGRVWDGIFNDHHLDADQRVCLSRNDESTRWYGSVRHRASWSQGYPVPVGSTCGPVARAKFWLPIIASSFGMMLLPIAYITFFLMMNSKRILGDEKPTGISMTSLERTDAGRSRRCDRLPPKRQLKGKCQNPRLLRP